MSRPTEDISWSKDVTALLSDEESVDYWKEMFEWQIQSAVSQKTRRWEQDKILLIPRRYHTYMHAVVCCNNAISVIMHHQ
jgi:hypothetical protein